MAPFFWIVIVGNVASNCVVVIETAFVRPLIQI